MESDSSDAERLSDLESLDDFLASIFDVDDEDGVEGSQENAGSLGIEPYRFEPFHDSWRVPRTRIRTRSHHQTGTLGSSLSSAPTLSVNLPERNESIELCLPAMLAKDCTALYTCTLALPVPLVTNKKFPPWKGGNRWAGLFLYNPAWFKLSRACSG